jgi:hypothetical protein
MLKKAVQQGRSKSRTEAYPLGYVEGLNDARTTLAVFFSILLKLNSRLRLHTFSKGMFDLLHLRD